MEWMFLAFTVGALVYGVSIAKEYKEAKLRARVKLDALSSEREEIDAKVGEHEEASASAAQQVAEVKKAVEELQSVVDKRNRALRAQKQEDKQKGKIRLDKSAQ